MAQVCSATAAAADSEVPDLMKLVAVIKTIVADESGATMVEYAILGGLTASLLVLAVLGVSDLLAESWTYLAGILLGETPFAT
jgi:Flp pilus assembly pilin Flp